MTISQPEDEMNKQEGRAKRIRSFASAHPTSGHLVIRDNFPYYLTMLNKAFQLLVTKVSAWLSPFRTVNNGVLIWLNSPQFHVIFRLCTSSCGLLFSLLTFQGQPRSGKRPLYMWLKLINGVSQT